MSSLEDDCNPLRQVPPMGRAVRPEGNSEVKVLDISGPKAWREKGLSKPFCDYRDAESVYIYRGLAWSEPVLANRPPSSAVLLRSQHISNVNYGPDSTTEDGDLPKPVRIDELRAKDNKPRNDNQHLSAQIEEDVGRVTCWRSNASATTDHIRARPEATVTTACVVGTVVLDDRAVRDVPSVIPGNDLVRFFPQFDSISPQEVRAEGLEGMAWWRSGAGQCRARLVLVASSAPAEPSSPSSRPVHVVPCLSSPSSDGGVQRGLAPNAAISRRRSMRFSRVLERKRKRGYDDKLD
ncbi:hypothetical protein AAG570_014076 [Ranatra chinensis]|uniref:Uncharacterized protein n=1 Tax=Ranatra chinensis TaxID=642074 RepID=A0ABD0XS12_9HEMI